MRKLILALLAAGGIGLLGTPALAAPGAAIDHKLVGTPVEQVRLYCRSNITGEFLYWGPCVQDRWRYRYYRHHHHYRYGW